MRTTLTLDDDVAAQVAALQERTGKSLKEVVNTALREGLVRLEKRPKRRHVPLPERSIGACRLPNLDNIADAIAYAEGDWHR